MSVQQAHPVPQQYPKRTLPVRVYGRIYSTLTGLWRRWRLDSLGDGAYVHQTSSFVRPENIAIGPRVMLFRAGRIEAVGAASAPQMMLADKVSIHRDVNMPACLKYDGIEGTLFDAGAYIAAPAKVSSGSAEERRAMIFKSVMIGKCDSVGRDAHAGRDRMPQSIDARNTARAMRRLQFDAGKSA